jgi:hypothetical protein
MAHSAGPAAILFYTIDNIIIKETVEQQDYTKATPAGSTGRLALN